MVITKLKNVPEFVICVSHLVCSEFGDQNLYDVYEDEEICLWKAETLMLLLMS